MFDGQVPAERFLRVAGDENNFYVLVALAQFLQQRRPSIWYDHAGTARSASVLRSLDSLDAIAGLRIV